MDESHGVYIFRKITCASDTEIAIIIAIGKRAGVLSEKSHDVCAVSVLRVYIFMYVLFRCHATIARI